MGQPSAQEGEKSFYLSLTEDFGQAEWERLFCKTDACLFLQRFVAISMHVTSRSHLLLIICSGTERASRARAKSSPKTRQDRKSKIPSVRLPLTSTLICMQKP